MANVSYISTAFLANVGVGCVMAKLDLLSATGALILSTVLMGCSSAPTETGAVPVQRAASQDRTPSWQKYQVSGSRIARRMDKTGKPLSADFVMSTTGDGLQMLPAVTMTPCTASRKGC
jgi:hypothetical protein